MPSEQYLAFDLGAESGRATLATVQSGVISTQEIHRFKNEPVEYGGALHWDVPRLWLEMRRVLGRLKAASLSGIGVDGWGVDYALLGDGGKLLLSPYHYRDRRTVGVMESVFEKMPREKIYGITGIQFMPINTLFQLYAANRDHPRLLRAARQLLMLPDLFHFWMTGTAKCEFTNATTTQLVNPTTRKWAVEIMEGLGLPTELLAEIVEPGTVLGTLRPDAVKDGGLAGTPVIASATHDTAAAVAAIAARDGTAFISSGTWSLVGTELDAPRITADALRLNFTNEGGVCGTTRFLKNVMGLWLLQCCLKTWSSRGQSQGYDELMKLAAIAPAFAHLVDPDHESFLRAQDMPGAIDAFCLRTEQPRPQEIGSYIRTILESLAFKYHLVIQEVELLTGRSIERVRVVGGGSRNRLLNQLTADATGKVVVAGPAEATSLGNIAVQILATGGVTSLAEARSMVERSYPTETFAPRESDKWDCHAKRFQQYVRGK